VIIFKRLGSLSGVRKPSRINKSMITAEKVNTFKNAKLIKEPSEELGLNRPERSCWRSLSCATSLKRLSRRLGSGILFTSNDSTSPSIGRGVNKDRFAPEGMQISYVYLAVQASVATRRKSRALTQLLAAASLLASFKVQTLLKWDRKKSESEHT